MLNSGLEGVVVAQTGLSAIDGEKGELIYAGYDIDDLARNTTFEEVTYLLWNGRLPDADELDQLNQQLVAERLLVGPDGTGPEHDAVGSGHQVRDAAQRVHADQRAVDEQRPLELGLDLGLEYRY